jgi:two-component system response regulator NreC
LKKTVIRILLVDDYAPWRRFVLSTVNEASGLEIVGEAAHGREAIERGLELKPDLILLDIGLPNLSGIEVARRVGEILPHTKIIFLTQNSDKELMAQCLNNGGMGYVVKGDAGSELVPAIEAVMQGTKYISKRMKQ